MPRKCKYTPDALEKQVDAYFALCKSTLAPAGKAALETPKPPTLEGLCTHLGLSRSTLSRYLAGQYPSGEAARRQVADCLERALDYMTAETLEGALLGRYDAKICAMILNRLGYGEPKSAQEETILQVEWVGVTPQDVKKWAE